jgi:hypothetical protein
MEPDSPCFPAFSNCRRRLDRMYHAGLLIRTMLLKNPGSYDKGSPGRTGILESSRLQNDLTLTNI